MLKVNQVVELKDEFKTPRCRKGIDFRTGRDYSKYKVIAIKKVNCIAYNLGTFVNLK